MTGYRYRNLTSAVDDKSSPLRQYLDQRYPNTKPIQAAYRAGTGPILVAQSAANAGTLGTAFDLLVKLKLDPTHVPPLGVGFLGLDQVAAVAEVLQVAQSSAKSLNGDLSEQMARACWALALCVEIFRVGMVYPGSSLDQAINDDRFTLEGLLALAPPESIRDLHALHSVAREAFYPHLAPAPKRLAVGPTFDGSKLCSADADVVADGVLIEVKTRLGALSKSSGARQDSLSLIDLYQLIAYVLFDHSDAFAIMNIGFYSARYGHFFRMPLHELLNTSALAQVDLTEERATVWKLLGGA